MLEVHAQPGAKRRAVRVDAAGRVRVSVTEPADRGKANDAVVDALTEAFGVRRGSIELVSGHAARRKRVRVHGWSESALSEAVERLAALGPR